MHTLRAVAIDGGGVVATDSDGRQFHVEIDDGLRSRLRDTAAPVGGSRKLSPREIQSHIRAGMSADEVAQITGAPIDYIQRYEGPVLAEREYVVESALGVPVMSLADSDPEAPVPTFGGVIGERLSQLSARGSQWASWKEQGGGWILRLSFTADTIDHDARWRFDPKKLTLSPLNGEAVALSQQGEIGSTLMPRLRAVPFETVDPDTSRFDSAAFQLPAEFAPEPAPVAAPAEPVHHQEPIAYGRGRVIEPRTGAVSVVEDKSGQQLGETADLLEALRRRRGEREAAAFEAASFDTGAFDAPPAEEPKKETTAAIRVLERRSKRDDATASAPAPAPAPAPKAAAATKSSRGSDRPQQTAELPQQRSSRRGRTSMPTWDEIVFGARPDDES
ncbi:septation protein SepH [Herbiconiux sp. L3-i23]|uniref:septation protein SepH n=1 Tax=Herbiconiux sp. L3-i23 TaxID=2905871 RepID=UPI00204AE180|nr:septation protein SepH [Herbiconiux sp. L3-i23]BDI22853.1 hypothetical protein L3i23_16290 [Herbiconiux sp. L3-i23]